MKDPRQILEDIIFWSFPIVIMIALIYCLYRIIITPPYSGSAGGGGYETTDQVWKGEN